MVYGQEVYHYLASVGLAPVLYQCIDVVVAWKAAITEVIDGAPYTKQPRATRENSMDFWK